MQGLKRQSIIVHFYSGYQIMTKWLKEIKKKFGVRVIKVKIASTTLQKAEKSTHNLLPTIQAKTYLKF